VVALGFWFFQIPGGGGLIPKLQGKNPKPVNLFDFIKYPARRLFLLPVLGRYRNFIQNQDGYISPVLFPNLSSKHQFDIHPSFNFS
jgi:hypothetical protein